MSPWVRGTVPLNPWTYEPMDLWTFSERNVVFAQLRRADVHRLGVRSFAASAAARAAAAATAAQQHDAVAADFGRVALVAVLVVPLPRLQAALDVDLLALLQVLVERFRLSCPTESRGATRSFPASGLPCRSRFRWSPGSAWPRPRRRACSAARRHARGCRPESLCSHFPFVFRPSSSPRPPRRGRRPPLSGRRLRPSRRCFARRPASVSGKSSPRNRTPRAPCRAARAARTRSRSCSTPRQDVALRVIANDALVGGDGLAEAAVPAVRLADVELRVVGEIGLRDTSSGTSRTPGWPVTTGRRCSPHTPSRTTAAGSSPWRRRPLALAPARCRPARPVPSRLAPAARSDRSRPARRRLGGELRHRVAQRLHVLRERREPHVGLVDLLAQHAEIAGDVVDQQLLSANPFRLAAVCSSSRVVDRLERIGQRDQRRAAAC